MKNKEDYSGPKNLSVPLLISSYNENNIDTFAIVNDKILFRNRPWNVWINLQGAFSSLLWLYTNFKEVFPVQCKQFFQGEEQQNTLERIRKNSQNKKLSVHSLVNLNAMNENQHFQYTLEINMKKNYQLIQMKNWTQFLIEADLGFRDPLIEEVKHLDHYLEMTPQQAFLLFANNCVAYFDAKLRDISNFEEINDFTDKFDEHEIDSFLFVREYLGWSKEELVKGEIQPQEILRYNGYRTLPRLSEKHEIQKLVWESFDIVLQFRSQKNE